ncbi:hypothetical protein MK079_04505 [Candidatus Gracilibacteria bacterium]|nr:hypothetical protein [Candidatus Gracilibacteria bacterium]
MQKFKVSVTKDQKKYSLVLPAENEIQAKERAHQEGYSVLGVEKIDSDTLTGKQFVFVGEKNGEVKNGKVVGEDIFKIFIKLKKELGYHILSLYDADQKETITEQEKQDIIRELEEQYEFYTRKDQTKKTEEKKKKNDHFYLKKELEDTYVFIDFVLKKIDACIQNPHFGDENQQFTLKKIYNSIIQIKKTTNISKLKEIGERALLKIGEIELKQVEKNKSQEFKNNLKQTNKLLKEVGSNKQFIQKDHDISYLLKSYILDIKEFYTQIFKRKKEKIDTHSYEYVKNALVLSKYKQRLIGNTLHIIKNFYLFLVPFGTFQDKKDTLLLERRVLKQNIILLQAKQKGGNFSYSRIIHFRLKIHNLFLTGVKVAREYLFLVLLSYSLLFLLYFSIILSPFSGLYILNFSSSSLLYIILCMVLYICLFWIRGLISLLFTLVFFCFSIIFFLVNF